jgi:hypothetical protein
MVSKSIQKPATTESEIEANIENTQPSSGSMSSSGVLRKSAHSRQRVRFEESNQNTIEPVDQGESNSNLVKAIDEHNATVENNVNTEDDEEGRRWSGMN